MFGYLVLSAIVSSGLLSNAQSIIRGKVIDTTSHQPLEAATICDKISNARAITDKNGNFYLKTASSKPMLLISYIGYAPKFVNADSGDALKVELVRDAVNLKELTLQMNVTSGFDKIAKIDLDLKPVRNAQELLRIVPGLLIAQHAGGGKAEQIFLRGFDCDHGTDVEISVDGMAVNMVSHAHGQGYADSHFIIPETINRVDFGAGPYYALHGNLNTAGYVSFSTVDNIDRSKIQVEAGRFDTYRALAIIDLLKKNKEKQSAWLAADHYFTNGPTENPQKFRRFNVFGKYNLAISKATQLTATASTFSSKWNASGQIPTRALDSGVISRFGSIDPSEGGNTQRHNVNVLLTHRFYNGSSWTNQACYSRNAFNLYSNYTFYLKDPVNSDEINQAEKRNLFGFLSKFSYEYFLSRGRLQSIYGAGIRYDEVANIKLAHVVKREFLSYSKLGDINESNLFAFAGQQLNVRKWLIDAVARLDYLHFNYFDKLTDIQLPAQNKVVISPKLNVQYTANQQLQLYLKLGKGFHSNDTRVVVEQQGHEILPAAYGSDIGVIAKPTAKLYINLAAWYLYLEQEFVYVGDDGNVEPSGKTKRAGIDLLLRYQFSSKFFVNINFNLTKPRVIGQPKGSDYIALAPTATSTGGLFYKQRKGFNGSLTYRYLKSRPANEDNSILAKGYFLMDASLNYSKPGYEVGLAIENIFDIAWNEAQFATESRLKGEPKAVTGLNFTPGTPIFARIKFGVFF